MRRIAKIIFPILFGAFLALFAPNMASAELVGYWPLDGDADDHSGAFFNNGTVMGGAAFDNDVPAAIGSGQSILLDGIDDYIDVGNNGGESGAYNFTTNDWTVSGWINVDSVGRYIMFGNGGNDGGGIRTNIGWSETAGNNFPKLTTDDNLELDDGALNNDFGKQELTSSIEVGTGSWYHIVGQRKGDDLLLFVNGTLASHEPIPAAGSAPELPNGYDLTGVTQWPALIGGNYRNSGVVQNFLPGRIDDVAVFDTALSPMQISRLATGRNTPLNVESANPELVQIAKEEFDGAAGSQIGYTAMVFDPQTGGLPPSDEIDAGNGIHESFGDLVGAASQALWLNITKGHPETAPLEYTVEFNPVDLTDFKEVQVSMLINGLPTSARIHDSVPYEGLDSFTAVVEHDGTGDPVTLVHLNGASNDGMNGMNGDDTFHLVGGMIPDDATTATLKLTLTVGGFDEDWYIEDVLFEGVASTPDLLGDANDDGVVDRRDLVVLAKNFGTAAGATFFDGDFNDSESVTLADLALLQSHYGLSTPEESPAASPAAVPEPSSLCLAILAVAAMSLRRRIGTR